MFKPITFKKFVAQKGGLSLEFFGPAPYNCHLDFFRKLHEVFGLSESLHKSFGMEKSYYFLRRMFSCLKLQLRTCRFKAGFLKYDKVTKILTATNLQI